MDARKLRLSGRTLLGWCFRLLVFQRRSVINVGPLCILLGVLCTTILIYKTNVQILTIPIPIPSLQQREHKQEKPADIVEFKNSFKKHNSINDYSKKFRVVKDTSISDLVKEIDLVNVTKPWFTVFPADEHIESFRTYFHIRNRTITTLPKTNVLDANIDCKKSKTDLLILIPSVVKDTKIRQDIRETWASMVYDSEMMQKDIAKVVFFFGEIGLDKAQRKTLKTESDQFGDVVTIEMIDSYKNLSLKIASLLQWSVDKCPSAKFVAKVDEDTWINIPLMIKLLENLTIFNTENNILASTIGFRHVYKFPIAVHKGKWEIPISLYPHDRLPRYVYGHSYVLSRNAVDSVVSSLPYFPIIPNEDAFITGIMSLVSNVTRIHSPAFGHLFKKQTYRDVHYNRFASSIHSKTNLLEIWNRIKIHNATDNNI